MRGDRGRLGVAVAYPLDPGAGSAAGAARRPNALSDGRRGAGAGVSGGGRRGGRGGVGGGFWGGRGRGPGALSPPPLKARGGPAAGGGEKGPAGRRRGD